MRRLAEQEFEKFRAKIKFIVAEINQLSARATDT
jgi:hypothetical protein